MKINSFSDKHLSHSSNAVPSNSNKPKVASLFSKLYQQEAIKRIQDKQSFSNLALINLVKTRDVLKVNFTLAVLKDIRQIVFELLYSAATETKISDRFLIPCEHFVLIQEILSILANHSTADSPVIKEQITNLFSRIIAFSYSHIKRCYLAMYEEFFPPLQVLEQQTIMLIPIFNKHLSAMQLSYLDTQCQMVLLAIKILQQPTQIFNSAPLIDSKTYLIQSIAYLVIKITESFEGSPHILLIIHNSCSTLLQSLTVPESIAICQLCNDSIVMLLQAMYRYNLSDAAMMTLQFSIHKSFYALKSQLEQRTLSAEQQLFITEAGTLVLSLSEGLSSTGFNIANIIHLQAIAICSLQLSHLIENNQNIIMTNTGVINKDIADHLLYLLDWLYCFARTVMIDIDINHTA